MRFYTISSRSLKQMRAGVKPRSSEQRFVSDGFMRSRIFDSSRLNLLKTGLTFSPFVSSLWMEKLPKAFLNRTSSILFLLLGANIIVIIAACFLARYLVSTRDINPMKRAVSPRKTPRWDFRRDTDP